MNKFLPISMLLSILLSTSCGSLFTDSMKIINSIPLPLLFHSEPYSAKGILDESFGKNGVVTADFPGDDIVSTEGKSIVTDKKGRIYIAGSLEKKNYKKEMVLWRYNPDGSPDKSFGTNGYIRSVGAAMDWNPVGDDICNGMVIDDSGIIYLVGSSINSKGNTDMVVLTYDDRILSGIQLFARSDLTDYVNNCLSFEQGYAIKIDDRKRILVTGYVDNKCYNDKLTIWRYNPNGILDSTFGTNGIVLDDASSGGRDPASTSSGNDIAILNNGEIMVSGGVSINGGLFYNNRLSVWKFSDDGKPDESFGNGGLFIKESDAWGEGLRMLVDKRGRLLLSGLFTNNEIVQPTIWCYTEDGTLDPSFGEQGIVSYNDVFGTAFTLDPIGDILVAGNSNSGFIIRRFKSDGTIDNTFGNNGLVVFYVTNDNITWNFSIIIDANNKIIIVGRTGDGNTKMTIWRYK